MKRSSSWKAEIRELPGGARQSELESELAFERLTEGERVMPAEIFSGERLNWVGSDGKSPAVEGEEA